MNLHFGMDVSRYVPEKEGEEPAVEEEEQGAVTGVEG